MANEKYQQKQAVRALKCIGDRILGAWGETKRQRERLQYLSVIPSVSTYRERLAQYDMIEHLGHLMNWYAEGYNWLVKHAQEQGFKVR